MDHLHPQLGVPEPEKITGKLKVAELLGDGAGLKPTFPDSNSRAPIHIYSL